MKHPQEQDQSLQADSDNSTANTQANSISDTRSVLLSFGPFSRSDGKHFPSSLIWTLSATGSVWIITSTLTPSLLLATFISFFRWGRTRGCKSRKQQVSFSCYASAHRSPRIPSFKFEERANKFNNKKHKSAHQPVLLRLSARSTSNLQGGHLHVHFLFLWGLKHALVCMKGVHHTSR